MRQSEDTMAPRFIVVCLVNEPHEPTQYWLACRNAWTTRQGAEKFASAIAESRKAIVVECPRGVDFRTV